MMQQTIAWSGLVRYGSGPGPIYGLGVTITDVETTQQSHFEVPLTSDDLLQWARVQKAVWEFCNVLPRLTVERPKTQQETWHDQVSLMATEMTTVGTPAEASDAGAIVQTAFEVLAGLRPVDSDDDFGNGRHYYESVSRGHESRRHMRSHTLFERLSEKLSIKGVPRGVVWHYLRAAGFSEEWARVRGKTYRSVSVSTIKVTEWLDLERNGEVDDGDPTAIREQGYLALLDPLAEA